MATPVTIFKKGDTVEGYKVLDMVGSGAASHIYLVQDPKTKHIWALKHVEKHEHKDSRFLDQAVMEGEIGEKLDSPSIRKIVKIIKKRRLLDPLNLSDVFVVMEFVDGISMEKEPPRGDLPLAVDLFAQTAAAMAHMHDRGFVHADMKPNNIMIVDPGQAKIIDLGQSCPVNTVKPRIQGTPDYIAPEQVHRRPITPKTDVYNLGATMYWVLTGQFIPTAMAKGDALVSRVDTNLLAKAKPVVEFNPSVPPRLNQLVMTCVEPDPERRPATMHAVADQLSLLAAMLRAKSTAASRSGAPLPGGPGKDDKGRGGSGAPVSGNGRSGAAMALDDEDDD
jgi:serine/threonine-protein kinase